MFLKNVAWIVAVAVILAGVSSLVILHSAPPAPQARVSAPAPTATPASEGTNAPQVLQALPRALLEVRRADGSTLSFKVEIASTPEEQARGLMFRRKVADGTGMLFLFDPPQPVSFWMKNTLVPLDMLFVRADGTVAQIATRAKPLDETPIPCPEAIRAVLEIGGGQAAALGLKVGDRLDLLPFDRAARASH